MLFHLLIAIALPASVASAECMACTESYGVEISLRNGTSISGYILWNHFCDEELFESYLSSKGLTAFEDKNFDAWIDMANELLISSPAALGRNYTPVMFKRIIEVPARHRFFAVDGESTLIHFSEVSSISRDSNFPLRVDATGLDSLPLSDIERLTKESPRFTVTFEHSVGINSYVVFGSSVSITDILNHYARINSGRFTDRIIINGVRINRVGPTNPSSETPSRNSPNPFEDETQRFFKKEREFKQKLFEIEMDCPAHRWVKGVPLTPKEEECSKRTMETINHYWPSLGTDEDLSKLGVIYTSEGGD